MIFDKEGKSSLTGELYEKLALKVLRFYITKFLLNSTLSDLQILLELPIIPWSDSSKMPLSDWSSC